VKVRSGLTCTRTVPVHSFPDPITALPSCIFSVGFEAEFFILISPLLCVLYVPSIASVLIVNSQSFRYVRFLWSGEFELRKMLICRKYYTEITDFVS
jgi:hypothetical protein